MLLSLAVGWSWEHICEYSSHVARTPSSAYSVLVVEMLAEKAPPARENRTYVVDSILIYANQQRQLLVLVDQCRRLRCGYSMSRCDRGIFLNTKARNEMDTASELE